MATEHKRNTNNQNVIVIRAKDEQDQHETVKE